MSARLPQVVPSNMRTLSFSVCSLCGHKLLSADKRRALHRLFAARHRSPAAFFDHITPIVAFGLFQCSKLCGRIRATLESDNAICRCHLCVSASGRIRCHSCCSAAGYPAAPSKADHYGGNYASRAGPKPNRPGRLVILPASLNARIIRHFHLPVGSKAKTSPTLALQIMPLREAHRKVRNLPRPLQVRSEGFRPILLIKGRRRRATKD
jgi:hypothetical protein